MVLFGYQASYSGMSRPVLRVTRREENPGLEGSSKRPACKEQLNSQAKSKKVKVSQNSNCGHLVRIQDGQGKSKIGKLRNRKAMTRSMKIQPRK